MSSLRHVGARICAALAAALFLALLLSLVRVDRVPAHVLLGIGALAIVSGLRPASGLAALAAAVPIAAWLGRQWNPSVAWAEALAVAFCAGYSSRAALRSRPTPSVEYDAIHPPFVLAVAVVLASLAVQLLIDAWRFGADSLTTDLAGLVTAGYFVTSITSDPIDASMRLLESLIVFRAAVSHVRAAPGLAARVMSWTAVSASAAAALNLLRLWEASLRLDRPLASFVNYIRTERLNVHYGDLNAAGSYFVMALFVAVGLLLARPRARGRSGSPGIVGWTLACLLIGSSIWITGSRAAIVAALLAMLIPAGVRIMSIERTRVRGTTVAAAALALAIVAALAAVALPERGNQRSAQSAVQVRLELAHASLRMAATSPSFGVGIGRYYSRSGEFASPELLRLFPPAIHENAHNNFLQILAELGIVGFLAVAWLLWTVARLGARLLREQPRDPLRWGLLTGLAGFVLSWLGGHPLLLDEPALTFWLLLGVLGGWGLTFVAPVAQRAPVWIVSGLIVSIGLSVPWRVVQQRSEYELEHRGIGLSAWQDAVDGVRYRLAGSKSSVFVPSSTKTIVLPLRSTSAAGEIRVELLLDGRPADIVKVGTDRWQHLRLHMPQDRRSPRFRRLDLRSEDSPSADSPVLMIGKVEPR